MINLQKSILLLLLVLVIMPFSSGQNYTSYFTGNTTDIESSADGGICLMGGATEDDEAMKWFLQRANGGDILVLRASGSDGYNEYLFAELGITVNSVESIVFEDASASYEPYIHERIKGAEAIWFAGGDQWNYVSYWRNTPVDSLINDALINRNIVIGGTSAGMAIQGGFYFSAQNGTVTSAEALQNPYNNRVTIESAPFLSNPILSDVITDTHYDDPDRKGRHTAFLARVLADMNIPLKGIACDEYTAVCIGTDGIAKVFGQFPDYDDNAYFLQPNCELDDYYPEICMTETPLNWNHNNEAVKVYKVKGTPIGSNSFDLNDWKSGEGGEWENWWVENGVFNEESSSGPNCIPVSTQQQISSHQFSLVPNPTNNFVKISGDPDKLSKSLIRIIDIDGSLKLKTSISDGNNSVINIESLNSGVYIITINAEGIIMGNLRLVVL